MQQPQKLSQALRHVWGLGMEDPEDLTQCSMSLAALLL